MASVADWDREDVKAAIRKRGMTLTGLAILHDYTGCAVRKALRSQWPAVEEIIAEFLGKHPKEIWPSRYHSDGTPRLRSVSKRNNKRRRSRRHRQKTA